MADHQHRESDPLHFVMGRTSMFYIERAFKSDASRGVWAVYFGPYCSNGSDKMGVGQGGAIASVFDLITAQLGSMHAQARTPVCPCTSIPMINYASPTLTGLYGVQTVRMVVDLKKPTTPIPGVFKVEAWIEREEGNRIVLKGELSDGAGRVSCECEATLARVKRKSKKTAVTAAKL